MNITPNHPHRVAALAHQDLCTFEYGITAEIFGQARPEMGAPWYDLITVAPERGALRCLGGLTFHAERGLDALIEADTIVIPGWSGVDVPVPDAVISALLKAHARGARIATICSGVFVLAATGLLDGLRATTHWRYVDALANRHPAITVEPDVLYIDEAPLFTSAGSAAGIDLLLHIVRRDHGADKANSVARRLIMAPHRQGGQAQFIERPLPRNQVNRLAPLLDEMRANLSSEYCMRDLARAAGMSERTLLRRFVEATGMPPGEWLLMERVENAKQQLETSDVSIEQVAVASGFGSVDTLRHHFRRRIGMSPRAYRERFSARGSNAGHEGGVVHNS